MKKYSALVILVAVLFLVAFVVQQVQAQLVMHDARYRVVKVVPSKDHVELTTLDGNPWRTVRYAQINSSTIVVTPSGKGIPWTNLRHGDIIRVKGGITWGGNISTDKIVLLSPL